MEGEHTSSLALCTPVTLAATAQEMDVNLQESQVKLVRRSMTYSNEARTTPKTTDRPIIRYALSAKKAYLAVNETRTSKSRGTETGTRAKLSRKKPHELPTRRLNQRLSIRMSLNYIEYREIGQRVRSEIPERLSALWLNGRNMTPEEVKDPSHGTRYHQCGIQEI